MTEARTYSVAVVATDAAGNTNAREVRVARCVTLPEVTWSAPDTSAPIAAGEVTVSGTVQSPLTGVVVEVNGKQAQVQGSSWTRALTLADNQRLTVTVTAKDPAGNVAKEMKRTLIGKHWADPVGSETLEIDGRKYPREVRDKKWGIVFVLIPPGTFLMGSPEGQGERDERPQHRVRITRGFYLGKTEITQKQWVAAMKDNPSYSHGDENLPAENMTWAKAREFLGKLGAEYRLPTEAEWEYACRGGKDWAPADLGSVAWYNSYQAHPVGQKASNPFGLQDILGNVWEWCEDEYDSEFYGEAEATRDDPANRGSGASRVVRGGSWSFSAAFVRPGNRVRGGTRTRDVGLRAVRTL